MDLVRLRELLRVPVADLGYRGPHRDLEHIFHSVGLPQCETGSKAERARGSLQDAADADLPGIAEKLIELFPPAAETRNAIQDVLWEGQGPAVLKRTRRELAQVLQQRVEPADLFHHSDHFEALLERLFDLTRSDGTSWQALDFLIKKHVVRNPGDWPVDYLFEKLGAFECSDHRFALFLEGLVSSDVRADEADQRAIVELLAPTLKSAGLALQEVDHQDGYPVFRLRPLRQGVAGQPKNLIFAGPKPDLRLRDAVNNDIEIATNADKVLVYDRPIPQEGLRWKDLESWWSQDHPSDNPKRALYLRLNNGIPESSPPQKQFFKWFFTCFKDTVPNLPALLPEVWLHWDPKTIWERGPERALPRFRMDFLMLFSPTDRVVLEVDGKQHYAEGDKASPTEYAKMIRADRDLRLAGYEVYRFGGSELTGDPGKALVERFFRRLFKKHGIRL